MIAESVAELSTELLSAALSRSGPEVTVTDVAAQRFGTGQMGTTYRLTLQYADGGGGPTSLIAKLTAADPAVRPMVADGYRKEVAFYQQIAGRTTIRAPRCHLAEISDDGTVFTLLLEDLDPAVPGVQAEGCTVEQGAAALSNVAGLHGPCWNDASLTEAGVNFSAATPEQLAGIHGDATEKFIEYFGDRLHKGVADTMRRSAGATQRWLGTRTTPFTVVHGDYRLDNLMFAPDGEVIALDWQTMSLAPPLRDVAYFLGTCLDVELRRGHERDLVTGYHAALLSHGVADYDLDRCFDDYRLGLFQGPLITTIGCMYSPGDRPPAIDEMFLAMANRSATAIADLDPFALLG